MDSKLQETQARDHISVCSLMYLLLVLAQSLVCGTLFDEWMSVCVSTHGDSEKHLEHINVGRVTDQTKV